MNPTPINPRVSTVSLIDTLYEKATEYAKLYHLPDTFTWYCIGATWHTVGMSSSMIGDFLDYCRKEFDDMRERLEPNESGS